MTRSTMKLVHVQVFFRHGARTPLHHVRSPAVEEAFWTPDLSADLPETIFPIKLLDICTGETIKVSDVPTIPPTMKLPGGLRTGQLITHGQKEAFELGRRLKQTYMEHNGFISENLPCDDIFCRSTRILRTVISMRCVAAGLFGGCLGIHSNKNDVELPVFVETFEREFLFPLHQTGEVEGQVSLDGAKERNESKPHLEMRRALKSVLGVPTLLDDFRPSAADCPVYFVRDDYLARKRAGFPLPTGLEELIPVLDKLSSEELCWEFLGKKSDWDENIFSAIGSILHLILFNMKNYNRISKFHLYSCHDSTLMFLLYALGCFDGIWPPFASDLIFELYLDEQSSETVNNGELEDHFPLDSLWVRVLYMGEVQPLGCYWKSAYTDAERYNAGYIPLRQLLDRWAPADRDQKA